MANVANRSVTNEAQQNTPDTAKMTSRRPILQIIAGTNIDRHAIIVATINALVANECVTMFPTGG